MLFSLLISSLCHQFPDLFALWAGPSFDILIRHSLLSAHNSSVILNLSRFFFIVRFHILFGLPLLAFPKIFFFSWIFTLKYRELLLVFVVQLLAVKLDNNLLWGWLLFLVFENIDKLLSSQLSSKAQPSAVVIYNTIYGFAFIIRAFIYFFYESFSHLNL